jgi:histidyl-tRNA synthetase
MKNKQVKAERPGGFLDFMPSEFLAREKIIKTISRVYRSYGFDPIETPQVEFLSTLSGEESDTGKNIFHIESHDAKKEKLALPFDHTVPFARLLAANPYDAKAKTGIKLPWRRMVIGPVFRGETPQAGRYRQFYQFDADIAGSTSMMADAEIIAMIYKCLSELDVNNFEVRLNNRKILNGIAGIADVKARGNATVDDIMQEVMRTLDKIDKIGIRGVTKELQAKPKRDDDLAPALSKEAIEKIKLYLEIDGDNNEKLDKCLDIFDGIDVVTEGVRELKQILTYLEVMNIPASIVKIDFSIARGLDYYTGPVMETILLDAPEIGSIFSGGRYDGLVRRFTGEDLPAVGASVGIDRLFTALTQVGAIDVNKKTVAKVMVLRLAPDKDEEYIKLANEIREIGINTEVCLLSDTTFKNQFNFALNRGVEYVVIMGEDEMKKNTVEIKNLETREQTEVKRNKIESYF